ncbi:MAG: 30S ribosomal protein S4 [Ignavibacteriae bacterium HGW-Ignavibacteriae-2]|jgi:small subunit ribosomal protein S4|nr:30S ribosomal protein S4 [Bacteroidota bacterium]PKL89048.1 MAG: 30S ribosomal protein S4 [Ignavibacteriae bacterium HGW-Ignavibacteriae-2]
MARYTGPSCKLCRREKQKLFLKGSKCNSEKCPLEQKNYPPGQHGLNRRAKFSEYGVQLREKQKVKRIYGILETQFRTYFENANRQKGVTGANLIMMLERRLDNVVFRLGFSPSRKAARQLVLHGHLLVNGQTVNVPSFLVAPGDVVSVRDASKKMDSIHDSLRRTKDNLYSWLQIEKASLSGTFLQVPEREEIPLNANEQLIVELYSK